VHPQSIVHSMVEFIDGSTLAQASPPSMKIPISLALGWPDRVPEAASPCDWTTASTWEFYPLDDKAFPAVAVAREAGRRGGTAPAVYNAANEECVTAFQDGRLAFTAIVDTVATVLAEHPADRTGNVLSLDDVLAADSWARVRARELVEGA
jgi:1-deoxy-D-xylulose-5-phosphate reductoisomerase